MFAWVDLSKTMLKDIRESVLSLTSTTFGVFITGIIIGLFSDSLNDFPVLLILIPPAIAMRGNIFASLGSRLGTYLHTGQISIGKKNPIIRDNLATSFTFTFIMSLYLGVIVWIFANQLGIEGVGENSLITIVLISFIAGFFSALIMILFTFFVSFKSYNHGWNPDNITAPMITLAGDITTLPFLFLSYSLVVLLDNTVQTALMLLFILISLLSVVIPLKANMAQFKKIFYESIPVFFICGLLSSFSGIILGFQANLLLTYTALVLIIPAFLEDGGAIGGILASRFSSSLHIGEIKPGKLTDQTKFIFVVMHIIGLVMFSLIGLFGYVVATIFHINVDMLEIILVSLLAGQILIFFVNFFAYYSSTISFKIGINPDNVVIPILTSSMDFIGTVCLLGVALLLKIS